MVQEYFLIWVDILGFELLARKISEEKGLEERKVRRDFIEVMRRRISSIERLGLIQGMTYGEKDDWLIVTNSMNAAFRVITEILNHNTGYEEHENIPLEIAIGIGNYDKWTKFDGTSLIVESSTIDALKTNITNRYRNWYMEKHEGSKIESTYVVLTASAYDRLEPLDKIMCSRIECRSVKGVARKKFFYTAPVATILRRGKIIQFLEKIEHSGSRWYDRIDSIYIAPTEYKDIKGMLEKENVVFITGAPECGKTYTAVRLLWEYFMMGYEPVWVKGSDAWQREQARERLEDVESQLKLPCIVYFEDPFGVSEYESQHNLEREIGTIIECIRLKGNLKVIVTSREEVFKQLHEEHLSLLDLRKFEKKLSLKRHLHAYGKRRKILALWALSRNCKWLKNDKLRKKVERVVENGKKLPTPLSIKNFAISTANVTKTKELMNQLDVKSQESEKSFAKEIATMSDEKIVFLSFPLISALPVDFINLEYSRIVEELGMKNTLSFGEVLEWFEDDKVTISQNRLEFSHPSYLEAMKYLLFGKTRPSKVHKEILDKLVVSLAKSDSSVARHIVFTIIENFDQFPADIQNLLVDLAGRDSVAGSVAAAVAAYYDRLPKSIRMILTELANRDTVIARDVARAVSRNFHKIPRNSRNKLLRLLARREGVAAKDVVWILAKNFTEVPKSVGYLLVKLANRDDFMARQVVWAVAKYFDRFPERITSLITQFAKKESVKHSIVRAVACYFNTLPENVKGLLVEFSKEDSNVARIVAISVAKYYKELPESIQNLLVELAKRDTCAGSVGRAIADNFDRLPDNIRKLLVELSKRDSNIAEHVIRSVAFNFREGRIPHEYVNMINRSSNASTGIFIDSHGRLKRRTDFRPYR